MKEKVLIYLHVALFAEKPQDVEGQFFSDRNYKDGNKENRANISRAERKEL